MRKSRVLTLERFKIYLGRVLRLFVLYVRVWAIPTYRVYRLYDKTLQIYFDDIRLNDKLPGDRMLSWSVVTDNQDFIGGGPKHHSFPPLQRRKEGAEERGRERE